MTYEVQKKEKFADFPEPEIIDQYLGEEEM